LLGHVVVGAGAYVVVGAGAYIVVALLLMMGHAVVGVRACYRCDARPFCC